MLRQPHLPVGEPVVAQGQRRQNQQSSGHAFDDTTVPIQGASGAHRLLAAVSHQQQRRGGADRIGTQGRQRARARLIAHQRQRESQRRPCAGNPNHAQGQPHDQCREQRFTAQPGAGTALDVAPELLDAGCHPACQEHSRGSQQGGQGHSDPAVRGEEEGAQNRHRYLQTRVSAEEADAEQQQHVGAGDANQVGCRHETRQHHLEHEGEDHETGRHAHHDDQRPNAPLPGQANSHHQRHQGQNAGQEDGQDSCREQN